MRLWKLILSYDGSSFHGWQVQPDLPTIQGTLAAAIRHITGETVLPQGSGRTDAGVHALAQVASFSLACAIPVANLHRALNRLLPGSIRILSAEIMDPPFHARHSAIRKSYEYRIFPSAGEREQGRAQEAADSPVRSTARICPPILAPYVWDYPLPLHLPTLNRAASHILGRHDFTSFAATGAELPGEVLGEALPEYPATPPTASRIISTSQWSYASSGSFGSPGAPASGQGEAEADGHQDLLVYRVTGSGFLHHMVRNLVGTFVHAGAGRASADAIPEILAARSRSAAGSTAPARGLFLVNVEYS
ncbi:MAG: tRNA pseudouridine synthase A [Acidobacteriaceae bacterium]